MKHFVSFVKHSFVAEPFSAHPDLFANYLISLAISREANYSKRA